MNMEGNTCLYEQPTTLGVGLKGQILKLCRCKYIYFSIIKLSTKTTYLTGICYDLNDAECELRVSIMRCMCCDLHVSLNNPLSGNINVTNLSCFFFKSEQNTSCRNMDPPTVYNTS